MAREEVLIVAITKAGDARCVGGLTRHGKSVRLIPRFSNSRFWPTDNFPFRICAWYTLDILPSPECESPHMEDHIVNDDPDDIISKEEWDFSKVADSLLTTQNSEITRRIWKGPPNVLFDGILDRNANGKYYLQGDKLYEKSTGFWIPNADLMLHDLGDREYEYYGTFNGDGFKAKYVGATTPFRRIASGTLVRVSLSTRPHNSNECWLMISGCFLQKSHP